MLRGFYTAASGILTNERTLNVLTNNMANAKTRASGQAGW